MALPRFKASHTVAQAALAKGGESRPDKKPARASDQGEKINAKPLAGKKDGRGRPKGERTVNILLTLPEAWLAWIEAEMDRRHMTSRPMTIRAVIAEAMGK
jgi:hypothetical protein